MLAGAGHDVVYYQMQQPILADQRFMISGHAAQWSMFETNLNNLRPDLVIAPILARMGEAIRQRAPAENYNYTAVCVKLAEETTVILPARRHDPAVSD